MIFDIISHLATPTTSATYISRKQHETEKSVMAAQTRSWELRRDSSAPSELIQPPPDLDARIQRETLEKERLRRQQALTAGTKTADHHKNESDSTIESMLDEEAEATSEEENRRTGDDVLSTSRLPLDLQWYKAANSIRVGFRVESCIEVVVSSTIGSGSVKKGHVCEIRRGGRVDGCTTDTDEMLGGGLVNLFLSVRQRLDGGG
ncbi:hypothetical protein J1614_004025 [Plenodomus biglobosus]|nr:hypothetical protein J1614_004025 [Plenodomus biglobosus]